MKHVVHKLTSLLGEICVSQCKGCNLLVGYASVALLTRSSIFGPSCWICTYFSGLKTNWVVRIGYSCIKDPQDFLVWDDFLTILGPVKAESLSLNWSTPVMAFAKWHCCAVLIQMLAPGIGCCSPGSRRWESSAQQCPLPRDSPKVYK